MSFLIECSNYLSIAKLFQTTAIIQGNCKTEGKIKPTATQTAYISVFKSLSNSN